MRAAGHYDALKELHRHLAAERDFGEAGREALDRQAGEQHNQVTREAAQPEHAPAIAQDERDAARAAYAERLDAKVEAKKIDAGERRYQMARYDNNPEMAVYLADVKDKQLQTQDGVPAAGRGRMPWTDRGDMVSQQGAAHAAARAALDQHLDKGAPVGDHAAARDALRERMEGRGSQNLEQDSSGAAREVTGRRPDIGRDV